MKKQTYFYISFTLFTLGGVINAQNPGFTIFQNGPSMHTARIMHYQTLLPGNRIAAFGGHIPGFVRSNTAEIWDGGSNTWTQYTMNDYRDGNGIAKLSDGKIFLMGGCSSDYGVGQLNSTEVFNPSNNSFTAGGPMTSVRTMCRATTLNNGKVLIVGNWYSNANFGNICDSSATTCLATDSVKEQRAAAILLPTNDGKALVIGGYQPYNGSIPVTRVELYDNVNNTFSTLQTDLISGDPGWMLSTGYALAGGSGLSEDCRLANGKYILMAYKSNNSVNEYTLVSFDPATKIFAKINTTPSIPNYDPANGDSTGYSLWPMVDKVNDKVYFWGIKGSAPPFYTNLFAVDMGTNTLAIPTSFIPFSFLIYTASSIVMNDGKIFVSGGSYNGDNFSALDSVMIITPSIFTTHVLTTTQADNNTLNIYPNPTDGIFNLKLNPSLTNGLKIQSIEVTNILGEKIYEDVNFQINSSSNFQIDLSKQPGGIYTIRLNSEEGSIVKKLVRR